MAGVEWDSCYEGCSGSTPPSLAVRALCWAEQSWLALEGRASSEDPLGIYMSFDGSQRKGGEPPSAILKAMAVQKLY
jgi:hypothetical protein